MNGVIKETDLNNKKEENNQQKGPTKLEGRRRKDN